VKLWNVMVKVPPVRGERRPRNRQYAVIGATAEDAILRARIHEDHDLDHGKWSAAPMSSGVLFVGSYVG
jgi:hypothetical protein